VITNNEEELCNKSGEEAYVRYGSPKTKEKVVNTGSK